MINKIFIALSLASYFLSGGAFYLIDDAYEKDRVELVFSLIYSPFWVILLWVSYLSWKFFINSNAIKKDTLVTFAMNAVVFLGWVGVIFVQFSVFYPHA